MVNVSGILNAALVLALVAWVLYRQTIARPVSARGLWILPGVLVIIGLAAISNVDHGNVSTTAITYLVLDLVSSVALGALRRMGQILFLPPNVKGWDGGAAWLNSQTMLTRENFASSLQAKMGDAPWVQAALRTMNAATVSRDLTATILQGDVSAASTAQLAAYLNGSNVSALAGLSGENADERIRGAAYLTMAMPAYQLA